MTRTPDRVTVVTSCTGVKAAAPGAVPAEDLYRGQQHLRLMRGVRRLRDAGTQVDLWVVSAGYGLVRGSDPVERYDRTFTGLRASKRQEAAQRLGIPAAIRDVLTTPS